MQTCDNDNKISDTSNLNSENVSADFRSSRDNTNNKRNPKLWRLHQEEQQQSTWTLFSNNMHIILVLRREKHCKPLQKLCERNNKIDTAIFSSDL